jgi:hypothetical protein
MESTGNLDAIRNVVQSRFAAFGVSSENEFSETILVRDSHYCGRRFGCGGWRAVWFVEEQVVKFFDADGGFRENLNLDHLAESEVESSEKAA